MNDYDLKALKGKVEKEEIIQRVWGDYGTVVRQWLNNGTHTSVINKRIRLPEKTKHPRGWNTSVSKQRKLASFGVEVAWYRDYSNQLDVRCLSPVGLVTEHYAGKIDLVMTDLAAIGLTEVVTESDWRHWKLVLTWLANFHAKHINRSADALWPIGSYWHLETRQEEYQVMAPGDLKLKAGAIDQALNQASYQTLIHGDAKLANFCFSPKNDRVGAVDFQYVGKGCGIKDVMLFISSCVPLEQAEGLEQSLLAWYFEALEEAVQHYQPHLDASAIEAQWRGLYDLSWADFVRFLKGWAPDHWKICDYSEKLTASALTRLSDARS